MEEQSYAKHAKIVTPYHRVLFPLLLLLLIGSGFGIYHALGDWGNLHLSLMFAGLVVALIIAALFARLFALGVQDRVIRAEENMRHYMMTGKPLDSRLTVKQIVGLRFASDDEFVALAARAATDNLSQDDIKKAVQKWRADHDRI